MFLDLLSKHAGRRGIREWLRNYWIEKYARIWTEVDISSEFRYRNRPMHKDEMMVIALSQSGETADTLACVMEAKSNYTKVLSFVNVAGSSIDRNSDGTIYSHAGIEIGVASTKNYWRNSIPYICFPSTWQNYKIT